jgi:hypothetical protein
VFFFVQRVANGDILTAKLSAPMGDYESFSGLKTDPFKVLVLGNGVDSVTIKGRELALEIPMLVYGNPPNYQANKRIA